MQFRREEFGLFALGLAHIGHTHLKKNPLPQCEHCQCILTVCHILVECNNFAQESKR